MGLIDMGKSLKEFTREMSELMPRFVRVFLSRQSGLMKKSADITMSQIAVLHLLRDIPRCKMSTIAKFLNVTTSAATGTVDRMVRSGLLKRVREAGDRRIINIKLTAKGEKTIDMIFKERQKMMRDIFRHFDPKDREVYLNTVKKIYEVLTGDYDEKA